MSPEEIVQHVKDYAAVLGGEFNLTMRGVPRIIMHGSNMKISLVYVARANVWKAFYPYPAAEQYRKYFSSIEELTSILKRKGCKL